MTDAMGRMAMPVAPQGPAKPEGEGPAEQAQTVNGASPTQTCPKCGAVFPTEVEKAEGAAEDLRTWFDQNHPPTQMARSAGPMAPTPPRPMP
jgi:hypothetical protein